MAQLKRFVATVEIPFKSAHEKISDTAMQKAAKSALSLADTELSLCMGDLETTLNAGYGDARFDVGKIKIKVQPADNFPAPAKVATKKATTKPAKAKKTAKQVKKKVTKKAKKNKK